MPKIVDHDRYRHELLMKCFDLFAQKGYGSVTMRQIAVELGVSTGTLYHYFPSKEALFVQLIEEITEQDILKANEIAAGETIAERIRALSQFLQENEDYFLKQIFLCINFFQQQDLAQEPLLEALKRSNRRYQKAIVEYLGLENRAIANHVACLFDGLISYRAFDPDLMSFSEQTELLAQLLSVYLEKQQLLTSSLESQATDAG
ncbi:MAG: TetR/AcrR family transcriptional regulator [Cyanophyceae cyanobacterium]